jgi:putative chitinase
MSITIAETQLKQIMPTSTNTAVWIKALNEAMERFEIDTPQRAAAFFAQIAHESGELGRLVENLSYSAKRLMQVWPKHFPTLAKCSVS